MSITQTQWHGNPRPRRAYAWTENTTTAASPYYKDGRTVAVYKSGWSWVPFAETGDDPTGATDIAGPAALVSVSLAGPFDFGTAINWTFTGDTTGATSDTYTVMQEVGMSPEEVLVDIAGILGAALGTDGVVTIDTTNPRQMDVAAAGTNTTFTVTTWTVT